MSEPHADRNVTGPGLAAMVAGPVLATVLYFFWTNFGVIAPWFEDWMTAVAWLLSNIIAGGILGLLVFGVLLCVSLIVEMARPPRIVSNALGFLAIAAGVLTVIGAIVWSMLR